MTGAAREPLGQRYQQRALAPEPLHQPARCDAGLVGDIREGELVGPAPAHDALGRCKHFFIRNLLPPSAHGD